MARNLWLRLKGFTATTFSILDACDPGRYLHPRIFITETNDPDDDALMVLAGWIKV